MIIEKRLQIAENKLREIGYYKSFENGQPVWKPKPYDEKAGVLTDYAHLIAQCANKDETITRLREELEKPEWQCKAGPIGSYSHDPPQECDWPTCGCDPNAGRVMESLQECGWEPPEEVAKLKEQIAELKGDTEPALFAVEAQELREELAQAKLELGLKELLLKGKSGCEDQMIRALQQYKRVQMALNDIVNSKQVWIPVHWVENAKAGGRHKDVDIEVSEDDLLEHAAIDAARETTIPRCLHCQQPLEAVTRPSSSALNPEQFASVRAGDWFCRNCKGDEGKTGFKYFWQSEIDAAKESERS